LRARTSRDGHGRGPYVVRNAGASYVSDVSAFTVAIGDCGIPRISQMRGTVRSDGHRGHHRRPDPMVTRVGAGVIRKLLALALHGVHEGLERKTVVKRGPAHD